MRSLMPLMLCALQAPAPAPAPEPDVAAPAKVVVEPWPGTVEAGFAAMRQHAADLQFESARTIADRLLAPNGFLRWKDEFRSRGGWRERFVRNAAPAFDWLGLDGLDANARAEVRFARGVVDSLEKLRPEARADFEAARAGASDRGLRHDAIYDLGVLALEEGEEIRSTLPEITGKPPAPPPPIPPANPTSGQKPPPDPIQLARAAYMQAREHFVERLKSDWNDGDTQANVELCLKRLRQLDEIEKKREEEKKKQDEQKQKDQDQKQDPKDKQDQKNSDQKSDKNDSKEDPKPNDQKPEDQQEPKKPEEKKPDEKQDPKQEGEKKDVPPPDPKEAQMSREEMTQLLDRLKQLEDESKKIQAQLKAARRGKVKKDW